jgi:hypothetical protein
MLKTKFTAQGVMDRFQGDMEWSKESLHSAYVLHGFAEIGARLRRFQPISRFDLSVPGILANLPRIDQMLSELFHLVSRERFSHPRDEFFIGQGTSGQCIQDSLQCRLAGLRETEVGRLAWLPEI